MQSLRDKLLKAGLVTEEQAKKAKEPPPRLERPPAPAIERGPPARAEPRGPFITARPQALGSAIAKLPPMAGSKAHQRLESLRQEELKRTLRDLVRAHEVPLAPGATVFYFVTRKQKLRRLELSESQAKQLELGELAVVERPEPGQIEHSLITPEGAEKTHVLSPKAVRFFNRPGAPVGFLTDEEIYRRQGQEAQPDEAGETPSSPANEEEARSEAPSPAD